MPRLDHLLPNVIDVFESYPYKVNISLKDGLLIYGNSKFLEGTHPEVASRLIGNYNILTDPQLENWGLKEHVELAFKGRFVKTTMIKFPSKTLPELLYRKESAFLMIYHDITSFPLLTSTGEWTHVVTLFEPCIQQAQRSELLLAKHYIENNWQQTITIAEVAKAANLSASHLNALFRKELGFTVHAYQLEVRMKHLCTLLINPDISISSAFEHCGLSYNSHYTTQFKAYSGLNPTQYRQRNNAR